MAKKNWGYSINYVNNTMTLTRKFYNASLEYNSAEYRILQGIKTDFPLMRIVYPAQRKTNSKATINYKAMTAYINCIPHNAQRYHAMLEDVKRLAKSQKNKIGFVKKWFFVTFPDFGKIPIFDESGTLIIHINEKAGREAISEMEKAVA